MALITQMWTPDSVLEDPGSRTHVSLNHLKPIPYSIIKKMLNKNPL